MASEWEQVPIGSLCEGIYDGPHATPVRTDAGPVFLGISSLVNGRLDLSQSDHLSEEDFTRWTRRVVPIKDDLVFSYETRLGEAALIPEGLRCCLGRRMALMRLNRKKADPRFVLYAYLSPQFQNVIRSRTKQGSTVTRILLTEFSDFPIAMPSIAEQRAIGEILGALDDRINLLTENNKTCEGIARAIFKAWFVDFDPVRAKVEGREPEGMDAATAALFPSGFQDSKLGAIPTDWAVFNIGNCVRIGRGASPRPIQDYMNGEVPWIKIADATSGDGTFIFETKEHVKRAGVSKSVQVSPGDLIMSNSASCGIPVFVELHGCIHDGWLYFRDYQSLTKNYLYYWLKHISAHLVNVADGSVQKNLNTNLVGSQSILIPPPSLMERYDQTAAVLLAKMRSNVELSRTISDLRDTLLPRLISGKLRVPEAEKMVEAVL